MNKFLIDTNVFYNYLILVEKIDLDLVKSNDMIKNIEKFSSIFNNNKIYITPITICEVCEKFKDRVDILSKIFCSIVKKISIIHKPLGFCIEENLIGELADSKISLERKGEIAKIFIDKRHKYESQFTALLFESYLKGLSNYYISDNEFISSFLTILKFSMDYMFFLVKLFNYSLWTIQGETVNFYNKFRNMLDASHSNKSYIKFCFNNMLYDSSKKILSLIDEQLIEFYKKESIKVDVKILPHHIDGCLEHNKQDIAKYFAKIFNKDNSFADKLISDNIIISINNFLRLNEFSEKNLYVEYLKELLCKWFKRGTKYDKNDYFDSIFCLFVEKDINPICFDNSVSNFFANQKIYNLSLKDFN